LNDDFDEKDDDLFENLDNLENISEEDIEGDQDKEHEHEQVTKNKEQSGHHDPKSDL
jgi:hypothetical protein